MVLRHLGHGMLTLIPSRHSTMNAASGGWSLARNHLQAQVKERSIPPYCLEVEPVKFPVISDVHGLINSP
jgi:hypothetical protein